MSYKDAVMRVIDELLDKTDEWVEGRKTCMGEIYEHPSGVEVRNLYLATYAIDPEGNYHELGLDQQIKIRAIQEHLKEMKYKAALGKLTSPPKQVERLKAWWRK